MPGRIRRKCWPPGDTEQPGPHVASCLQTFVHAPGYVGVGSRPEASCLSVLRVWG